MTPQGGSTRHRRVVRQRSGLVTGIAFRLRLADLGLEEQQQELALKALESLP